MRVLISSVSCGTTAATGAPKRLVLKPEPDDNGGFALEPVDGGKAVGRSPVGRGTPGPAGKQDPADALGLKVLAAAVERDGLHLIMDGGAGKLPS
ncbi:hypothetical protein GCM10010503_18800 [Streptomyces lucensis JCM 4490]|uniref:Uncharacterized protein n=1 Tax=Streptomyces lucensis JCM 4490 TaxID=1306176 RepID=A0A918MPL3_9ACTN|nr:hypothetical protein [Streptomyces lucensis]GGW42598.1 hypothetical protein GCM10010503_18800 [Streptomyces lucensis JCM 4490]